MGVRNLTLGGWRKVRYLTLFNLGWRVELGVGMGARSLLDIVKLVF